MLRTEGRRFGLRTTGLLLSRERSDLFTGDGIQTLNLDDLPCSALFLPCELPARRLMSDITVTFDVNSGIRSKMRPGSTTATKHDHAHVADVEIFNLRNQIESTFDHRLDRILSD